jgi:hypothetical protein
MRRSGCMMHVDPSSQDEEHLTLLLLVWLSIDYSFTIRISGRDDI